MDPMIQNNESTTDITEHLQSLLPPLSLEELDYLLLDC